MQKGFYPMKYSFYSAFAWAALLASQSVAALEMSAGGRTERDTVRGQNVRFTNQLTALNGLINELSTTLAGIRACSDAGKVYAPTRGNADGVGCVGLALTTSARTVPISLSASSQSWGMGGGGRYTQPYNCSSGYDFYASNPRGATNIQVNGYAITPGQTVSYPGSGSLYQANLTMSAAGVIQVCVQVQAIGRGATAAVQATSVTYNYTTVGLE
mgnify:CR=1 FL=1